MLNCIKWVKKVLSVLLCVMVLSGTVSLPAVAGILEEQAAYHRILNADIQCSSGDVHSVINTSNMIRTNTRYDSNKQNQTKIQKNSGNISELAATPTPKETNNQFMNVINTTPALASGLTENRVFTGYDYNMAIRSDGTVWAWGFDHYGQINAFYNIGTNEKHPISTPVLVNGLSDVVSIAFGTYHGIALKSDGTVWAWGQSPDDHYTPTQVSGLTDVIKIAAAGECHSLALKSDGTVWAWGYNLSGELGDGTTIYSSSPVQVSGLTGVIDIAAGYSFSLALKSDGTVWAWGSNYRGQLGDGTTSDRTTPVQVSGLTDAVSISSGTDHSIAIKSDGTVWAWGQNYDGQLGDGTTATRTTAVQVSGLTGVVNIAAGQLHNLAIKSDGTVWAWGNNISGQLGDGTTTNRTTPVQVNGLTGAVRIAAGCHSLAVLSNGTVWAWGNNYYGQLGDGTTTNRSTPALIDLYFGQLCDDNLHFGESSTLSGNFARTYTDMSYTAPGFNVEFSRTYNSKDNRTENIISPGWTFGFQGNVEISGNTVIVRLPQGNGCTFKINSDGTYTAKNSRSTLVKNSDDSYTLTTKDQYAYGFNAAGYLTWMKDRNGNTISITLDGSNKPTQITDQTGRTTTIAYTNNKIHTITDPAGRVVTYNYDENNRLYQVSDPNGYSTYYYYGANGLLSTIKDNTDTTVIESVTYLVAQGSNLPRVDTVTDKYGNATTYTYNDNDGILTTTDSNSRTTRTWYDEMFYQIRTVDAEGKETLTQYSMLDGLNIYGEISSYTDRNGNTTYYQRDDNGNVILQTNPDDSTKEYTYDSKNNVLSVKDENGKYTYYVYDSNGINLLKTVQPLNGTETYSDTAPQEDFAITTKTYYSDYGTSHINGLVATETDPEGGVTTYTYDSCGNIATVVSPTDETTTYVYNILGWLKSVTTPKGYSTSYYYDKNGNQLKQVNADSGVIRNVYDFRNNVIQKIMPTQYTASADTSMTFNSENIQNSATSAYEQISHGYRYVYLDNGLLSTDTDQYNNQTSYTYDLYGNKLSETKPNGAVYWYTYDVMNRVKQEMFQESENNDQLMLKEYAYDILENGNTTMTVTQYFDDTTNAVTKTTYDYAGRQIRLDQADGTYTTNTYNANGTLGSSTDARGSTTYYAYDGLNRLIQKWSPVGTNAYEFTSTTYDKANRVTQTAASKSTATNGTVPTANLITVSYTYDADGKVQQELKSSGAKTEYAYDDDGNVSDKYVYYDATNATHESYVYNNMEKLVSKSVSVQNQDIAGYDNTTTELALTSSYTYDLNGNVLTSTDENGVTTTNTYDAMDRLLTTSRPGLDETGAAVTITSSMTYDWAGKVLTSTDPNNHTTACAYDKQENLIKTTDALNGVQYFVYDRAGHKTAEVSPSNFAENTDLTDMSRTEYDYDAMGRVLLVTQVYYDSDSSSWKTFVSKAYTYDANGNVTYEQDALGYQNNYGTANEYDNANRLIKTTTPAAQQAGLDHTMLFTYDGLGRVLTQTDANNAVTSFTYNDDGKVLTKAVGGITIQTNTYDLKGNVLSSTDGNGNTTAYAYNNLNQIRSVALPGDGNVGSLTTTYKYTKLGQLAESVNSLGKQQIITYDNQGHVLTTTEQKSDGTQIITSASSYDKAGNLRFKTDGNGNTTEYTYDALNRSLTQTVAVTDIGNNTTTQTTTLTYDANGNKLTEQNWRGNTYAYTYDKLNRLVLKTDPYGKTIEKLVYNDNGAQTQSIDALNNTTQYVYDRDGRLVQTIDAMNHSAYKHYDGAGNVIKSVDANGNETNYAYDAQNRLVTVEDALSEVTSYTYDNNGNMLTQTDGKGNVTTVTYNCRNLPVQRIDAGGIGEGGVVDPAKADACAYNADGTVSSMTDKNGVTTACTYDIHGRTLSVTTGGDTVSYTYDNNGNTLTMTDSTGTTTRVYDELNRTISKTAPGAGTSTFQYDVTASMPEGCVGEITTDSKGNVNTKIFDKAGRLYQVTAGGDTTTYTYYDNGNRQLLTYPNGITAEYTYYADNRLHTLANKCSGGSIINAYNYAYDNNGNLLTKLDISGTTSYTYDALNRLLSVTEPDGKITAYTFDASGNRTTQQVTNGSDVTLTEYTYTAQNRLTSAAETKSDGTVKTTGFCYDNNGNTVSSHEETLSGTTGTEIAGLSAAGDGAGGKYAVYGYDVYDRLTSAKDNDSVSSYTYNGDGLRVGKTVTKDNATTTTKFVYEYDKVVLELDENGSETAYNVYGGDMLLSRKTGTTTIYYLYNGHGDVVNLTDDTGIVVMTYDYDAFGVVTTATGSVANSYLYAGYQFDSETGMYYLNARYYDPVTARFMSADTYLGMANDPLSLNLYTYCHNEPMMYSDPSGTSDVAVKASNQSQGNFVKWNGGTAGQTTITITTSSGPKTLYEGQDYYIGSNGSAYYINDSAAGVRTANNGNVSWTAGSTAGNSTITVNGTTTLQEGKDYYIGNDGTAYYYNGVRTALNTAGYKDEQITFNAATSTTKSSITVNTGWWDWPFNTFTLKEGTNYYIGADGKAHSFDGPPAPGTYKSTAAAGQNGTTTGSTTGINDPVYYSQHDSEWGSNSYGSGTISSSGCGPTSIAMVISTLTDKKVTPDQMAKEAEDNGYKTSGGTDSNFFYYVAKEYGFKIRPRTSNINNALDALKSGNCMVIVSVTKKGSSLNSNSEGYFTGGGHFMVITAVDDNNNVTVYDPNAGNKNYKKAGDQIVVLEPGKIQVSADVLANDAVYYYICTPK